jgi:ferritin-like metal-binding protein YciE
VVAVSFEGGRAEREEIKRTVEEAGYSISSVSVRTTFPEDSDTVEGPLPQSGVLEDRQAHLEGEWEVEHVSGLLPSMGGIRKRIRGNGGETRVGPLPVWSFRSERKEGRVALVNRRPFSVLVDELRPKPDGSWLGRSTLLGLELGEFRMISVDRRKGTRSKEEGNMDQQGKLRRKLVEYVQNVHAMEQNVLLMLDSIILTTEDSDLAAMFQEHKEVTRRQERRLNERLKALGGLGLTSTGKDIMAIATAQAKGVADLWRTDKAVRNARDAFVTEHLEIAAYEVLERLAERAGDSETAEVARTNRAEEETMAQRVASNWDRFLDLTLIGEGSRTA